MNELTPIPPNKTCSAFEAIANAMRFVTEEDWQKIYEATRSRLLHSEHDGKDTRSNRVLCEMTIANALFDIRDAFNKQNKCVREEVFVKINLK